MNPGNQIFQYRKVDFKEGFHGDSDSKDSASNAGDLGSIPRSGRPLE